MAATTTTVVEELPLIRSKTEGIGRATGTDSNVGPCTYDVDYSSLAARGNQNNSRAPFNTTSERPPLSRSDPRVPGPGKYDVRDPEDRTIGVASCPFVSGSVRFQADSGEPVPGPGSYNVNGKWPHKASVRSHKFSEIPNDALSNVYNGVSGMGPGYYNPEHSAISRSNPRVAHFGKYSSRMADRPNTNPGPGSYNPDAKPRSLYAHKPSSMFATNTNRVQHDIKDTPGPGDYEIGVSLVKKTPARSLGRSAFGTSAPRFDDTNGSADAPGPGWYTGEVAARRPKYCGSMNTHPFLSTADRFADDHAFGPGPGSYDARKLPKHMGFGGSTPFGSTVPRFAACADHKPAITFDDAFGPARHYPRGAPRRTKPLRPFIASDIKPTTGPEQLPERSYDVKYDWPKPTSLRSPFDTAARSTTLGADTGVPGPGSYIADGSTIRRGGNSSWGKDIRFLPAGAERGGTIGPGRYHHESTFLKKSFNCTIGSDLTW